MRVGDLVKIYNYTAKARAEAREKNRREAPLKDINAHRYGIIVKCFDPAMVKLSFIMLFAWRW